MSSIETQLDEALRDAGIFPAGVSKSFDYRKAMQSLLTLIAEARLDQLKKVSEFGEHSDAYACWIDLEDYMYPEIKRLEAELNKKVGK